MLQTKLIASCLKAPWQNCPYKHKHRTTRNTQNKKLLNMNTDILFTFSLISKLIKKETIYLALYITIYQMQTKVSVS